MLNPGLNQLKTIYTWFLILDSKESVLSLSATILSGNQGTATSDDCAFGKIQCGAACRNGPVPVVNGYHWL